MTDIPTQPSGLAMAHFQDYEAAATLTADGKTWAFGVADPYKLTDKQEKPLLFPVVESGDLIVMLMPNLITAGGKIEDYSLVQLNAEGNGERPLKKSSLPAAVCERLVELADTKQLHGLAGYHSMMMDEQDNPEFFYTSHILRIGETRWEFAEIQQSNGEKLAAVRPVDMKNYRSAQDGVSVEEETWVQLEPKALNGDKIVAFQLQETANGDLPKNVSDTALPPRVLEELTRFANHFRHFGLPQQTPQERDAAANDILSANDMDAGLARLVYEERQREARKAENALNDDLDAINLMRQESPGAKISDLLSPDDFAEMQTHAATHIAARNKLLATPRPESKAELVSQQRDNNPRQR